MKNAVAGQSFFVLYSSRRCYISIIKNTFHRFLNARLEVHSSLSQLRYGCVKKVLP